MSAVAVREPEGTVEEQLAGLAETIRQEHTLAETAIAAALQHAIRAGDALLAAREVFGPGRDGKWEQWLTENVDISMTAAFRYMRVAFYQDRLPEGISLSQCRDFLANLPPVSRNGRACMRYPEQIKEEAKRIRREEDLSYRQVAERLQVNRFTVQSWFHGPAGHAKRAAKVARKRQMARALRLEEAEKAARQRGGTIGAAYVALRAFTLALDAAHADSKNREIRKELESAFADAYRAEDKIMVALGIEHGGQSA